MRASTRLRNPAAFVLAGLLLVAAAPIQASQEQAVAPAAKESDDETNDSEAAKTPPAEESASATEAASDPAFNTLEDIVRLRAAAALLARCHPPTGTESRPLTIAWRDVED